MLGDNYHREKSRVRQGESEKRTGYRFAILDRELGGPPSPEGGIWASARKSNKHSACGCLGQEGSGREQVMQILHLR